MNSFMPVRASLGIKCINHDERPAVLIQYNVVIEMHGYGPMECVGAFCSQECAEGNAPESIADVLERVINASGGPVVVDSKESLRKAPDAHLGAKENS